MKTLGLIGGSTWVSTVDYYRIINQKINERAGGDNSAKLLLYSMNFQDLRSLSAGNNRKRISDMLCDIAVKLESAGADCILLCANTLHQYAEDVLKHINIPLIHIAEVTAIEICSKNINRIGLLGTKYTMEKDFYKDILAKYNIETLVPDKENREFIHNSIYNELGKEIFLEETKAKYIEIINKLAEKGAKGIILGCTEIPLLIEQADCSLPVFNTTLIHAQAAVEFALND
ncbi:MAG: aspartate/glutamate racemase family protein [Ignavibacteriae bacterium]|nr:MAG: aspartate/glutamate racemase family protein [Ignavibacteriota bacterium]